MYILFHLDIGDAPQNSDVFIVAGGQIYRESKAKELLDQGYCLSNKVIVSPISEYSFNSRKQINQTSINPENIEVERNATSTWTNATESIKAMQKKGWKSAIVVTSDFYTRRTRLSFERAVRGKKLYFTYVSPYLLINGEYQNYMKNKSNEDCAKIEIPKYWGYLLGLYDMIDLD